MCLLHLNKTKTLSKSYVSIGKSKQFWIQRDIKIKIVDKIKLNKNLKALRQNLKKFNIFGIWIRKLVVNYLLCECVWPNLICIHIWERNKARQDLDSHNYCCSDFRLCSQAGFWRNWLLIALKRTILKAILNTLMGALRNDLGQLQEFFFDNLRQIHAITFKLQLKSCLL